jgi:predicted ATPase
MGQMIPRWLAGLLPLALFLDDLQWLDPATLELLERLITDRDVRYLMLVGAYRDNEVSSSHPLTRTLPIVSAVYPSASLIPPA